MLALSHVPHKSHRHSRAAFHVLGKVCQTGVWPATAVVRGTGTTGPSWESVLSEENKAGVRARLANMRSPRQIKQQNDNSKMAAVLVPLCCVEGELSLLYTLRCRSMGAHAGEISFPGGMADVGDKDEVHTALREAQEEIGLGGGKDVEVLGVLPPVPDRLGGTKVVGVLAYLGHLDPNALILNPGEVETVIVASLINLCHPAHARQTQFRSAKIPRGYTLPVYLGTEPRIWGLTAIFTHMALTALLPGLYTLRLNHVPPLSQ